MLALALFQLVSAAVLLFLGLAAFLAGKDERNTAAMVGGVLLFCLAFLYARAAFDPLDLKSPGRLRRLSFVSIGIFVLVSAIIGWGTPILPVVVAVSLSALFGGTLLLAASGFESSARRAGPVPAGSIDGAGVNPEKKSRARWLIPIVGGIVLILVGNAADRTDTVGGKWQIVWIGSLPEAGSPGPWPKLHRRRLIGTRQVDQLVREANYVGDDCVVYIAYGFASAGLRAACANHSPILLSGPGSGIDWGAGHPEFRTDPIQVGESTFVSVAEIKKRAVASR